jgi:hypothetical protein
MMRPIKRFDSRLGDVLEFGVAVNTVDVIAPQVGTRKLKDYFAKLVRETK